MSLCARMELCVSQCATSRMCRRRFPRQCTIHVDDSKCNGPKTLSRRRSFLSVMLCDFLTAGRHARHTVQAFPILRHPRDPLFLFPVTEPHLFLRSPSPVMQTHDSSTRFNLLYALCTYHVYASFTCLCSSHASLTSGVCSNTHRSFFST